MRLALLWFAGWASAGRVVFACVIAFVWMLVLIRFFGKRTISKMNPSDFVITVAVGSTMANFITSKDVTVADGLIALACLLFLQLGIEFLSKRIGPLRQAAEGQAVLLFHRGRFLEGVMNHENVNHNAIRKAIREKGIADLESVYGVVLEIDGTLSVIPGEPERETALQDVKRVRAHR